MVTNRSSVDPVVVSGPPNVAVRAAEKRGYEVSMEQPHPPGRPASDDGRSGSDTRTGGAGHTSGVLVTAERPRRPRWRERISTTLALVRANPTGRITLKIAVAIVGALVVTIGIALIPLPGPGWLLVIAGLGIWAVEYHWARRLLAFTRRHVYAWTNWAKRQSLPLRFVLGSVGLLFVGTVVWLSLKYSFDIDLVAIALDYLGAR